MHARIYFEIPELRETAKKIILNYPEVSELENYL
jgi:hypothetical protein